jgi:hypothetical protein
MSSKIFVMVSRLLPFALALLPLLGSAQPPASAESASAEDIVHLFDSARPRSAGSETVIKLIASNGDERRFRVLDDGEQSSLVEFLDPLQRGTRILATATDLWFYAPRTRRAIKIPPLQRLFGEASYGDIAKLRLASDYHPEIAPVEVGGGLLKLVLAASSPGATYSRVALFVNASTLTPVKADYFVASGKHFRSAEFPEAKVYRGRLQNDRWRLLNPDRSDEYTDVWVERSIPRELPGELFTRHALEQGR